MSDSTALQNVRETATKVSEKENDVRFMVIRRHLVNDKAAFDTFIVVLTKAEEARSLVLDRKRDKAVCYMWKADLLDVGMLISTRKARVGG